MNSAAQVKGGFGAWVDLLCTWPVTTLRNSKSTAKWTANRTVRELMLDHQCPDKVKYDLSEEDRSALERTRMSNAKMARFGIFDDLQVRGAVWLIFVFRCLCVGCICGCRYLMGASLPEGSGGAACLYQLGSRVRSLDPEQPYSICPHRKDSV